jgi:acyl-CoA reductase-like NAD-dependent aldehyde dehydrogenase
MSSSTVKLINPYDQTLIREIPHDTAAAVEQALDRAWQAFRQWREFSLEQRTERVERALRKLKQNGDAIARDVTLQMGKPLSQARGELDTLLDRARQSIEDAPAALAPDLLPEKAGFVRRIAHEPLGVVLNIAAWNYPLVIPINVIVPALLAGNVILLKHSHSTLLTGQALEDAFAAADLPGLVTNLVIDHQQTARLIGDRRIAHVAFTGSVGGGRQIYRAVAADRFIDVGLELGGKDPAYVAADADLNFAAVNLVDGACYNAGQSCCAIERVYVHHDLYEPFLAKVSAALSEYRLGDPLEEATTMGPLARQRGLEELQQQVDDAVARGGQLLLGGKRVPDTEGNFYPPTLVAGAANDARIMQEESFGPLLPVAPVQDDDEAIRRMNDSPFGLTASVWTADVERAERFADRLQAGTIFQNRCDYLDPMLPWTGWGDSGKGSTLSRFGFYHLTRRKSIHLRTEVPGK